jgi:hypothetical protein
VASIVDGVLEYWFKVVTQQGKNLLAKFSREIPNSVTLVTSLASALTLPTQLLHFGKLALFRTNCHCLLFLSSIIVCIHLRTLPTFGYPQGL